MHGHSDLPTKTAQERIPHAEAWKFPLSPAKSCCCCCWGKFYHHGGDRVPSEIELRVNL